MNLMSELPPAARAVAAEQGWNEATIGLHLLRFVMLNVQQPETGIELFFSAAADKENGDTIDGEFALIWEVYDTQTGETEDNCLTRTEAHDKAKTLEAEWLDALTDDYGGDDPETFRTLQETGADRRYAARKMEEI